MGYIFLNQWRHILRAIFSNIFEVIHKKNILKILKNETLRPKYSKILLK